MSGVLRYGVAGGGGSRCVSVPRAVTGVCGWPCKAGVVLLCAAGHGVLVQVSMGVGWSVFC